VPMFGPQNNRILVQLAAVGARKELLLVARLPDHEPGVGDVLLVWILGAKSERKLRLFHGAPEELPVVFGEQVLHHLMDAVADQALAPPGRASRALQLQCWRRPIRLCLLVLVLGSTCCLQTLALALPLLHARRQLVHNLVGQSLSVDRGLRTLQCRRLGLGLGVLAARLGRLEHIVDELGCHRRRNLVNEPLVQLAARLGQLELLCQL